LEYYQLVPVLNILCVTEVVTSLFIVLEAAMWVKLVANASDKIFQNNRNDEKKKNCSDVFPRKDGLEVKFIAC